MARRCDALGDFRRFCAEKKAVGRVALSGGVVLGRIKFFDESYTEGSILCVRGGEWIDRETLLLCPPLAVVVFCNGSTASVGEFCSLGVPCVVMNDCDMHYESFKNSIAVLDAEQGILTVDPSIETLNFYSARERRGEGSNFGCDKGVILKSADENIKRTLGVEHYLISGKHFYSESVFESTLSLWERLKPDTLTLELCVPSVKEGSEREFFEFVFELYRAALYGSFALSLTEFNSEEELCSALKLMHKAFCLLEAESREFNGSMPRGITLSAPLWLSRPSPVSNPDFIILDLDRLLPSLFSLPPDDIIKKEKALKKELFSLLEHYFLNFAPRCDVMLKTNLFSRSHLLLDLVRFFNVKIVYCD